ncbi:methyltransferase domain-containing protein, partial [Bacteroidota bacterium]
APSAMAPIKQEDIKVTNKTHGCIPIACDPIANKMIELAKKKREQYKSENVNFIKTTLEDCQFKKESFDVIMAFSILHLLDNGVEVMKKINDLLKPGGTFISLTVCLGEIKSRKVGLQFLPFCLLSKTGLVPSIKLFKFRELEDLITKGNFQIIEKEIMFHEMSFLYVTAKKV